MPHSVIDRASAYLARIPAAISGHAGHDQTFVAACALVHGFALDEGTALALLRDYNTRCSPPWTEKELIHKIRSATATATHTKPRGHLLGDAFHAPTNPRPPAALVPSAARSQKVDAQTAAANAEKFLNGFRCTAADVHAASRCKLPPLIQPGGADWHRQGAYLISQLFEQGEHVNIVADHALTPDGKARPNGPGVTHDQNVWQGRLLDPLPPSPAGYWLRMNPCRATGSGQGGAITDADVIALRFALVEIDGLPLDLQLALLARLPLPIAALITSGGRSIHAWVRVDAQAADEYKQATAQLLGLLARFGVDGKNKNPSRLSRLPGVTRTIGGDADGMQDLLFLNPNPTHQSIL
jgi:hypothetical protein